MQRHFTREQVIESSLKMHESGLGQIEITSVQVIEDEEVPAFLYRVEFTTPLGNDMVDLYTEAEFEPGKFRLWPLVGEELQ